MLRKEDNPWMGLASYAYEDAYRFFGREAELEELRATICNNPFTTIYGISGAGKTSLINAGIMPLLDKGNFLTIRVRLDHQSPVGYNTQILNAIYQAVEDKEGEIESDNKLKQEEIPEFERLWNYLFTSHIWSKKNHKLVPVIFVDQFEEIFTQNDNLDRIQEFFNSINSLQYNIPPSETSVLLKNKDGYINFNDMADFRMVFIMREDFLACLEDYSYEIPALRKNRRGVKRMNGKQILDVIMKPRPDIVSREVALNILSKVTGQPVIEDSEKFLERVSADTSILSLFCSELYQNAVDSKAEKLTTELVEQYGDDIIPLFYDNAMKQVSKETMEYLETHLLTHRGFRNTVALEDLEQNGVSKMELKDLSEKRLIRIETSDGIERVEFTHDVLCQVAKEHRDARLMKKQRTKDNQAYAFHFTTSAFIFIFLVVAMGILYFSQYSSNYHMLRIRASRNGYAFIHTMLPSFILSICLLCGICRSHLRTMTSKKKLLIAYLLLFIISWLPLCWNLIATRGELFTYRFRTLWLVNRLTVTGLLIICAFLMDYTFIRFRSRRKKQIFFFFWFVFVYFFYFSRFYSLFNISWVLLSAFTLPTLFFQKKKNSWLLALLVSSLYFSAIGLFRNYYDVFDFTILFFIFLFALKVGGLLFNKKEKTDLISAFYEVFSFQAYKERPFLRKYSIALICVFLFIVLYLIGLRLSDIHTILYTPVICCMLVYLLLKLFVGDSMMATNSEEDVVSQVSLAKIFRSNNGNVRKIVTLSLMLLLTICGIITAQYWTGRLYFMLMFWVSSLFFMHRLFLLNSNEREMGKYNWSALLKYFFIWILAVFIAPWVGMGYNVFSLPQYARVYGKTISNFDRPVTKFLTIRDARGSVGLRDRNHLVIPVNNQSIELYNFTARYLGGASFSYIVEKDDDYYNFNNDQWPQIRFKVINNEGNRRIWDCTQHLEMDNICTTMLLSDYKSIMLYNKDIYETHDVLSQYFNALQKRNTSLKQMRNEAYELLMHVLDDKLIDVNPNISDRDNRRMSIITNNDQSRRKLQFKKGTNAKDVLYSIEKIYPLFPYLGDFNQTRQLIDTLFVECDGYKSMRIDYANMAKWRIYAKDFKKAEENARSALKEYPSRHNYAIIPLIEALFYQQKYDSVNVYLDRYLHEDCFLPLPELDMTKYESLDTIMGADPFNKRIIIGDALAQDLKWQCQLGWVTDTTSSDYLNLMDKLSAFVTHPPYSHALRMGQSDSLYYYCRNLSNGQFYKYFIYGDKQASPCYDRFSLDEYEWASQNWKLGYNGRIMLVMDVNDKKRKYISFTNGIPCTIPGAFDHAWPFSEGLAVVAVGDLLGVINTDGEYVISPRYKYKLEYPKEYGGSQYINDSNWEYMIPKRLKEEFFFKDGLCPMVDENGHYGMINREGQWVITPQ